MSENKHRGSTLDSLLESEGLLQDYQAKAIKEVIAWQISEEMKKQSLSKTRMAELMHTSRRQLERVLNPEEGNITIETLQRAAEVVGRRVHIELR